MNQASQDWSHVRQTFQSIWGYQDFRPPQGEIIRCLLASKDVLAVMPTGGGKSICFQLPSLFRRGLTLVVSPLVALMENQLLELQQRQLPAALLHNEIPRKQRKETLQAIERQELRLLYLSPETLLSPPVWERLSRPDVMINGLMLDEAHCLVSWGETFRPAYRRLGAVRPALLQHKPPGTKIAIAAFTATADLLTQRTIASVLQLQQPQTFCLSPYRSNLHLKVKIAWTPRCRRHLLLHFIQARKSQSGLVYVRSRRDCETLAQWMQSLKYATAAYHAGLNPAHRRELESQWLAGQLQFVICTSAFGLGINKSNVRWVVHFQSPFLLSEYLQEIGRGGRDGKPTDVLTLISEPSGWFDPADRRRNQYFEAQYQKQYQQARQISAKIPPQGDIETVTRQFQAGEMVLSLLHGMGQLDWLDPFHYQIKPARSLRGLALASAQPFIPQKQLLSTQMTRYLTTRHCRWRFLLEAFGFQAEAKGFNCGHCDNCQPRQ